MSFIDLIAILLIISLSYLGYLKGIKGKSFFVASLAISFLILYFVFYDMIRLISKFVPSMLATGIISVGFIIVPTFILIECILRKFLLKKEVKSFSDSKKNIGIESKIFGAIAGFIGGYAFVLTPISLTISVEDSPPFVPPPAFIQKSMFYKIAGTTDKSVTIKRDNIATLNFLYTEDVVQKYSLSKEELIIIFKMIKGISNDAANQVLELQSEPYEKSFLKLKECYENELPSIEEKYKTESADIEILFSRILPKKPAKKKKESIHEKAVEELMEPSI